MRVSRSATAVLLLALMALASWGCNGTDPGDASRDAGPEASVKDVNVPDVRDVMVPDARPYSPWCGDSPFPGVDPNAQELTSDPPAYMVGFSWDGTAITFSRAEPGVHEPNMDVEVYVFDLNTWEESLVTSQSSSLQFDPNVFQGTIVWSDTRYSSPGNNDYRMELVEYDLGVGSEICLTDSSGQKLWPKQNSNYILYSFYPADSSNGELHLLERSSGDVTILSDLSLAAEGESIGDRYVAWVALRPDSQYWNKDVHIYDLQTQETIYLESTANGLTYGTSVSGSKVVWHDHRNGQWDIYMYDVEAEQEVRLTDNPFDQTAPQIHGNLVTFRDYRFTGGWREGGCANDIYILDIDTMVGRRVTTLPWFWWGRPGEDGLLLAGLWEEGHHNALAKLYVFDLIAMGILDASGEHVLPEP